MEETYIVDGVVVSKQKFLEMQNDKNIKLCLKEGCGCTNEYITKQKLLG